MTVQTEARNASLEDLARILTEQQNAKLDFVAPATTIRSRGGLIHVKDADVTLGEDGVTTRDGIFRPTAIFDEGVAEKLGIPLKYVRTLRATRPDLYDANVNGWLHGRTVRRSDGEVVLAEPDHRSFLVRAFRGADGDEGVARALLSDSYGGAADNLDALTAVLDGVRESGVEISVDSADLTDRRMVVKISAPSVAALAPTLLAGYRSPYGGARGEENPTIFAGFVVSNSEIGDGAFSITPRLVVQICRNGMTLSKDAIRSIHVGGKLEGGIVRWSESTQRKNLDLITSKAKDAVATFLDVEYVRRAIAGLEAEAGKPISNADETIKIVAKRLAFTETERAGVLDFFIRGGQMTAGGIMQAVTAYVQEVPDADAAFDLEAKAVPAMAVAASL